MSTSPTDIVPADWPHWSVFEPAVVQPLPGGLTNQSYLIVAGKEKWVLRKNSAISDALDLNRSAEVAALSHADKAGLCAPLIYCDPNHQYLVTRFVEGKPWRASGNGELKQLARLLRRIHALPAIDARLDAGAKAASYWQSIDERADFCEPLRALAQQAPQYIAAALDMSTGACLCHNDLLASNLIAGEDGNLYAVDWEYTAMGDPFYELAVIVEEYRLNKQRQQLLLAEYLNRPLSRQDWRRLDRWRVIYGYLTLLWYAVQWCTGAMHEPQINDEIRNRISSLSMRVSAIRG
ncbi:thiamine kinase [Microbulbifer donghaiensis]|uniref:Thiamine kinase n=1 Tax=Microbulbifer donghaiensis TaxID=494016 RepID=A0A1M5A972_9GAMM|nr:choline/ethanolamine kinase family protein [Microbulbifer donghaiensis]SHF26861.1 thiamine kinase [Microbulbifer donghaiensis]